MNRVEQSDRVELSHRAEKPAPGWACIALGLGYVVLLGLCLVAVRILAANVW
jgi:hypothetical protein